MTDVWFSSDHHFDHAKVADLRGFADPACHNLSLLERHNDTVRPDDVVWMLGDLSAGGTVATRSALDWVSRMHGRKRLIAGNHCPIHPMKRDAHKWWPEYMRVFETVGAFGRVSVEGTRALLSHFPYETDRGEPRFTQYRLRNEGQWLLHGHLHTSGKVTSSREIHVGLDAWNLYPVRAMDVWSLMNAVEGV